MQNSMLELNLGAKQKKSMTNVKKTSTKANFPVEAVTKLNEPCDSKNKICDKFNKSADSDFHVDRDELLEEDLDGKTFSKLLFYSKLKILKLYIFFFLFFFQNKIQIF
jgi:hypothetical protein